MDREKKREKKHECEKHYQPKPKFENFQQKLHYGEQAEGKEGNPYNRMNKLGNRGELVSERQTT